MEKQNKDILQGYKDSPLGIIPEEWEVKKIKNFGNVVTGNTPPTSDVNNYGNNYMFASPSDLGKKKYITITDKMLSPKGFSLSRQLPKGAVLFTCIGSTIGKAGIASATRYLNELVRIGVLRKETLWKNNYYINTELYGFLANVNQM